MKCSYCWIRGTDTGWDAVFLPFLSADRRRTLLIFGSKAGCSYFWIWGHCDRSKFGFSWIEGGVSIFLDSGEFILESKAEFADS